MVRLSAEQGLAEGQTRLGVMYETGRGVVQSLTEAVKWYRWLPNKVINTGKRISVLCTNIGRGVSESH